MIRYKQLLVAAIWIFFAHHLMSQQHNNVWFRGTLRVPVGIKFKIDNEFQHRRQNGYDDSNMFDKNLMFTWRSWVHYQPNQEVKISLSPFAYFSNYKIIQKQADENAQPNKEIRFSAAVELQHCLFKKIFLLNRTALEYRIFDNNTTDITRLRSRFGFGYELSEKIKPSVSHEWLLNLSGTTQQHFFDHCRLVLNLEYRVLPDLKFDFGYAFIKRLPASAMATLQENNMIVNLMYEFLVPRKTNNTKNKI